MKFTKRIRKCENFKMNSLLSGLESISKFLFDMSMPLRRVLEFWGVIEGIFRSFDDIDKSIEIIEKFNAEIRSKLNVTTYRCWYEPNEDLSPHHSSGVETVKPGDQIGRPMGPSCSKIVQYYF